MVSVPRRALVLFLHRTKSSSLGKPLSVSVPRRALVLFLQHLAPLQTNNPDHRLTNWPYSTHISSFSYFQVSRLPRFRARGYPRKPGTRSDSGPPAAAHPHAPPRMLTPTPPIGSGWAVADRSRPQPPALSRRDRLPTHQLTQICLDYPSADAPPAPTFPSEWGGSPHFWLARNRILGPVLKPEPRVPDS